MKMKSLKLIAGVLLLLAILTACEKEELLSDQELGVPKTSEEPVCDAIIDFEPLAAGTIVETLFSGSGISGAVISGSVSVHGVNFESPDATVNHAMIFDTENPTGGDGDLAVEPLIDQKVLIISEDLDAGDPDDQKSPGGMFVLDFSGFGMGVVDVNSLVIIDTEEEGEYKAYDAGGILIAQGPLPALANATRAMVGINATGVSKLTVKFNGSGAMDQICLSSEEPEEAGCTLTQGYWKTHSEFGPAPYDATWASLPDGASTVFYLSGQTYYEVFHTAVKGNPYYQAAHQFIAAQLNILNGATTPEAVDQAIMLAATLFETYTPAQIADLKGNDPVRKQFVAISETLDQYNQGEIGPGHCAD